MKTNGKKWMICTLMMVLALVSGCGKKEKGCGDAACHGHGSETPIDQRLAEKCEHSIPIYQCDGCRYEVGIVKVDSSILKQANGDGLVRTEVVSRVKMSGTLPFTGEVVLNGNASVHITPRAAGIIESVAVDVGARVKAGDTLLTLASAELGKAVADYERNRTLSDLSGKILARETKLAEQQVASGQDVIDAQMAFEQHRTELNASEQMLHVLGLTVNDLAEMRGADAVRLAIRAPLAGTIVEKHAVTGEMVESGKDLMLLSDLSTVWVWANVHSRDLAKLLASEKLGPLEVEITVEAFPGRQFKGVLDYAGATMNEQSRTVKVRATVKNPDMELRPGMFCEASVSLGNGQAEEVLAVPRSAVVSDEGKSFVFKHWKEDFYIRQDVSKGREVSGQVEILDGLQAGETVVAEGAFLLKSDVLREKMGAGCAD